MDDDTALSHLEELAGKLGIQVRYEKTVDELTGRGGLCRVEGRYVLMIRSKAPAEEKIRIMTRALKRFDFADIYVRPAIRKLIEGSEE